MTLCEPNRCTGCCACFNSCAQHAIEMRPLSSGALVPVIDENLCVECGRCERACPVLNPHVQPSQPCRCYAAWATDDKLLENAASSGVVSALGKHIIDCGGVVYGTRFENQRLVFAGAETVDGLLAFQGSRYVHAYVGDAYLQIEQHLKAGRKVLFTGTPCQVHGLRQFLRKDYDNLVVIDLVCHGVAPLSYLNEYLRDRGVDMDYDNVVFRGKKGMSLVAKRNNEVLYSKYKLNDLFYTAYLKGLISRENCYTCPYASLSRYGDITVGDFWGLKRTRQIANHPFISVMFTNTERGNRLLADCGDKVRCVEQPLEMATKSNGQLNHPCPRHEGRDKFLALYTRHGLVKSIKKTSLYKTFLKTSLRYRALLFASKLKHLIYGK